ncbi:hypothetical protein GGS21DRAFT_484790 [Xylaria nigripes]|nr:hypothetical protein GGS21DRAFT_484790 [Xylaria nigripes]
MPPGCRRSARIASISNKQKESPAPQQLTSVAEANETSDTSENNSPVRVVDSTMSGPTSNPTTPSAASKKVSAARTIDNTTPSPMSHPVTPSTAAPVKAPISEMHPSKVHQTMAPPSSGLRNGFKDIDYNNTPVRSLIQNTPSKTPAPSSEFTFRYTRPGADKGLGPEAQKMMEELRDAVAKNKAELTAERDRDLAKQAELADGRKIATAKGKKGRFSDAHLAEFKKMDSIEGHPSSFRAAARATTATTAKAVTPVKSGIKRSQSNANLDEPDLARSKTVPRSLAKSTTKSRDAPERSSKRIRQSMDGVSALREGTLIPQPGKDSLRTGIPRSQTLGSLMTPTKSSLARTNSLKSPIAVLVQSPSQPELQKVNSFTAKVGNSLLKSPSKIDLEALGRSPAKKGFGGFSKWGTKNKLNTPGSAPTEVATPGRFDRIKSILKRQPGTAKTKSSIPLFSSSAAKTPDRPALTDTMFPPVPHTTPGRKQSRHVDFTADTKLPTAEQDSPSPVKPSASKPTAFPKIPTPIFVAGGKVASNKPTTGEVAYPDLSAYEDDGGEPQSPHESVPGTFTFRSDHTIRFESSPTKGFGSAAGQASVRQVRKSVIPSIPMPGAFPNVSGASPNKENKDPLANGISHGMKNKKRHRVGQEENEEDEGTKRGLKKPRKTPSAAEERALAAPKITANASPKKAVGSKLGTPSPQKKKTGLTLSRLQMLAQPKIRK